MGDEHTHKSIPKSKKGKEYEGALGAPTLQLKSKPSGDVEVQSDDDDMSALSEMSKPDLVAMIRRLNTASGKGSAPSKVHGKPASSSSGDEESSSGSSSSSSSTSSVEPTGMEKPAGSG